MENLQIHWRGCGHQEDLSHMLWSCPNLQGYCEDVRRESEQILDTKLKHDPKLFILGIPVGNQMGKKKLCLLRTLLLIAKKKHYSTMVAATTSKHKYMA